MPDVRVPAGSAPVDPEILPTSKIWMVILAASIGTMIEWYDFYIFGGSLAPVLAAKFYPAKSAVFQIVAYYSTFAVGFLVRPFGALFFGRIGDLVGRKYAFLVTLIIMGGCTFLIGCLPIYATIGVAAPIILIAIRVLQGLALGGEYGGAAVYVAEHVPDNKRGFYTSFIQITATLGLFVSLIVVWIIQTKMDPAKFSDYGWRIPFLISIFLVAISLYIRLRMKESPIFAQIKSSGMSSTQPLKDAFTQKENVKRVAISLFGATAGQGVVWYTGQFYALYYLQTLLKLNLSDATYVIAGAVLIGMPFFVIFGALSDRIGRKKIMMAGCLLAVICYYPIYGAMQKAAGNDVKKVSSIEDPITGQTKLISQTQDATGKFIPAGAAKNPDKNMLLLLVFVQVIFVTMMYGPIAAYLVEAFPAKVRYTSLSLPYHIGNGVFGGLVVPIGALICARTGDIRGGLWFPMIVAGVTFIFGSIFLKEIKHNKIWDEVRAAASKG